jgi:ribosomal protein L5
MESKILAYDYSYKVLKHKRECRVSRVIIHSSNSKGLQDRKIFLSMLRSLQILTGQKGVLLKTNKSVASFSSRKGSEVSASWVLRKTQASKILY